MEIYKVYNINDKLIVKDEETKHFIKLDNAIKYQDELCNKYKLDDNPYCPANHWDNNGIPNISSYYNDINIDIEIIKTID